VATRQGIGADLIDMIATEFLAAHDRSRIFDRFGVVNHLAAADSEHRWFPPG
jgi:hypothetical protein